MLRNGLIAPLLVGIALMMASPARAVFIDFESVPGGTAQGIAISNQFQALYGVTFALEGGGAPVLAEVGDPMIAFGGPTNNQPDLPAAGETVGSFFLTDDFMVAAPPPPVLINFDTPVQSVALSILDIDGWQGGAIFEGFLVEVRGPGGLVLDSVLRRYPDPGTGDGIATLFSFFRAGPEIHSIRISYDPLATKQAGIGFALDNLWFAIPEPSTLALVACGLAGLGGTRHRRARA